MMVPTIVITLTVFIIHKFFDEFCVKFCEVIPPEIHGNIFNALKFGKVSIVPNPEDGYHREVDSAILQLRLNNLVGSVKPCDDVNKVVDDS